MQRQRGFIAEYEKLLNSLTEAKAVLFVDAVHPTYATLPIGCWTSNEEIVAIEQTSGRQRNKVHGAINLETGQTRIIEAESIDAQSTIRLFESIEAWYPDKQRLHVFLDNARYHHARLVSE